MEGTIAEIRMFAGNFAPRSWLFCAGQLLSIAQNTAVFALLGTTYGGDGQTTFGIPDLRGRVAVGSNNGAQGPGLPSYQLGEMAGSNSVTLISTNLPQHIHPVTGTITVQANNDTGNITDDPSGRRLASTSIFSGNTDALVPMAAPVVNLTTGITGNNQPVGTLPPYLGMNYIICIEGIFPSRN
jgi:microcystin-dependent protein